MKTTKLLWVVLCLIIAGRLQAQSTYTVTDKQPAMVNGLEMGYIIKSQEVKAVGDKGNFSRYSVRFYVTNTGGESKIILYKQGLNILGNVSDQLAQFKCLNATGARLTSKEATINAVVCNVLADVEDKDCATNKIVKNKRFVQIGYWIKAGQSITADVILITPLNELPNVEATYLANSLQPAASVFPNSAPPPPVMRQVNQSQPVMQGFVKLRNLSANTYINVEAGTPSIGPIDPGWWSAQWELIPVAGTNYYNIKSRWKQTYLTTDNGNLGLFVNYMSDGSYWALEPTGNNAFRIRNVAMNGYLCIGSNQLKLTKNYNNVATADWTLEQP